MSQLIPQAEQPVDRRNIPIFALTPNPDSVVNITVSGTTTRGILPTFTSIIRIGTTTALHYRLGDSTVEVTTSNGTYLPANSIEEPIDIKDYTHIAVVQVSAGGLFNITKLV